MWDTPAPIDVIELRQDRVECRMHPRHRNHDLGDLNRSQTLQPKPQDLLLELLIHDFDQRDALRLCELISK
jgi:hypothetical protein